MEDCAGTEKVLTMFVISVFVLVLQLLVFLGT